MSKMRVPEMDVVRFKESDVIVASGATPNSLTLNFGNTSKVPSDGYVKLNGTTYYMTDYSNTDFLALFTNNGFAVNGIIDNGTKQYTLSTVIGVEYKRGVNAVRAWNGNYTYDSTNNTYTKQ